MPNVLENALEELGQFTGFKPASPAPSDFMHGGETSIIDTVRNDSLDWRPDEPGFKCQLLRNTEGGKIGDTNACTDFSGTNNVAAQLDWMILSGHIDPNGLNFLKTNGYLDGNGRVNLSPRFTAVMSGTTPQNGNNMPNVWASLRHNGAVPEGQWPMPDFAPGTTLQQAWQAYYAPIPDSVKALGKQFVQWFSVQYEWIAWEGAEKPMSDLALCLKVAPLHIATAVCLGWNTDNPIKACGDGSAHATTLVHVEDGAAYDILDHYNPYNKRFAPDYRISFAMRGVVASRPQNAQNPPPFTYTYLINLRLGAPASSEVAALQRGLQSVTDASGSPYMKPGLFGPFGPQTGAALARFQVDHGIADEPAGTDFGPMTRAALTNALFATAASKSGEPLPRPLSPDAHRPN